MEREPLQTDEVEQHLRLCRECMLSHLGSGAFVVIENAPENERAPWRVSCRLGELLDKPVLARALAIGFELSAVPTSGPPEYELSKSFFGIRAAAIRALELIRMLPGVPADAWVWASIIEISQLDVPRPEPPSPRPPD